MIDEVSTYYDSSVEVEWYRLTHAYSIIEYRSTLYLLDKYFPKQGAILDIGSGPGRYSFHLLKLGYKMSLLDISLKELDYARNVFNENGLKAEAFYHKSALELKSLSGNTYQGILIMGPMYHLHHKEERLQILKDAYDLLDDGGVALISYINTWGVLKASLAEFPESFLDMALFDRYIKGDLKFTSEEGFTKTFFTTPPQALAEVAESGFEIVSYAGAESFIAGLNMQLKSLKETLPEVYDHYIEKACEYCELPQYRDATEHLHIIVRK